MVVKPNQKQTKAREEDVEDQVDGSQQENEEDEIDETAGTVSDDNSEDPQYGEDGEPVQKAELSEEEKEERRERRREERRRRKEKQRERERAQSDYTRRLESELADLRGRVQRVEGVGAQSQIAQIDNMIEQVDQKLEAARAAKKKALAEGDIDSLDQADELIYKARRAKEILGSQKQQMERSARQPRQQPLRPDPIVLRRVNDFQRNHGWYDPQGGDEDSRVLLTLDGRVAEMGLNPSTDEYWKELEKLGKKYLPHRFKANSRVEDDDDQDDDDDDQDDDRPDEQRLETRRSKPNFQRGAEKNRTGKVTEWKLSRERRDAMLEAGYEPNSEGWKRMIKNYQAQDRAQNNGAR